MDLSKRSLYRYPWSFNDNPIGWLEITDRCNIYCRGCYRKNGLQGHKSLAQVKEEIDLFRTWRNCDNISIAGGEPLIHPEILDIVAYIRDQGMKPMILSNGVEVIRNPGVLKDLEKAGLVGFTFHVDSEQKRPHWQGKSETELFELRLRLARTVADAGDLWASFGMTVYPGNLDFVPEMVRWAGDNIDVVHGLVFITFRGAPQDGSLTYRVYGSEIPMDELPYAAADASEIHVTSEDVYRKIKETLPAYEASAYLGGTNTHTRATWVTGVQIGRKGKMFGSFGPKATEAVQMLHHLRHGTYMVYLKGNRVPRALWLLGLLDKGVRKAHRAFWKDALTNPLRLFRRPRIQSIGIVQGPDILADGRQDMCESCPDMTIWDGKFVHSCRLEEWRFFGGYVEAAPTNGQVVQPAPALETAEMT